MKTATPEYRRAIAYSHIPTSAVEPIIGNRRPAPLNVPNGSITFDRTGDTKAVASFTVVDGTRASARDSLPLVVSDLFEPITTEYQIFRGAQVRVTAANVATEERFSQGIYVVTDCERFEEGGGAGVRVELSDRSFHLRNESDKPLSLAPGVPWADALRFIITTYYPGAVFHASWPAGSTALVPTPGGLLAPPIAIAVGSIPWTVCVEGAAAIGRDLDLTDAGEFILRPVPNVQIGVPVKRFVDGANCVTIDPTRSKRAETLYNGVVVTPASGQPGIRGEAWDDRADSKTNRARIGPRPWRITRNAASTFQANAIARVELSKLIAGNEEVTVQAIPDGTLELGDLVYYEHQRLGIGSNFLMNRIGMPMQTGPPELASYTFGRT